MTNALVNAPSRDVGLPPDDQMKSMMKMAQYVADAGFAGPRVDAAGVLAIALAGREAGLGFMTSVRAFHVVEGKPSPSAQLMQAMIERDHGDDAIRIKELTHESCTISYRKREWPEGERDEHTFTMKDAQRAGLTNKNNWKQYPRNMLYARCISDIAHLQFPNSTLGFYTPDELGDESDIGYTHAPPSVNPDTGEILDDDPTARLTAEYDRIKDDIDGLIEFHLALAQAKDQGELTSDGELILVQVGRRIDWLTAEKEEADVPAE